MSQRLIWDPGQGKITHTAHSIKSGYRSQSLILQRLVAGDPVSEKVGERLRKIIRTILRIIVIVVEEDSTKYLAFLSGQIIKIPRMVLVEPTDDYWLTSGIDYSAYVYLPTVYINHLDIIAVMLLDGDNDTNIIS